MLKFLDVEKFCRALRPVSTTEMFTRTNEPNPQGLFSEAIFGSIGSLDRRQKFSYIDLSTKIVHPSAYRLLVQLDGKVEEFFSTDTLFSQDKSGKLVVSEEGITGISEFIKIFPQILFRGDSHDRERMIKILKESYENNTLFISKIPVIPPDFRPSYQDAQGNRIIDPLNEKYITILRRSFQVRSAGPGGIFSDLLRYGLQSAINDCDTFVRTKIGKKHGVIRNELLSKRVDFSGRAVITPNPKLKVNQVGLPLKLAVSLFEPFLIHVLLFSKSVNREELEKEMESFLNTSLSVDSIKNVIKSIKAGHEVPEKLFEIFFNATELAIGKRVVLIKRDPDLHPESIRASFPILTRGNTMELCTLQVGGFGADFDGDALEVFHPLTNEAQEEAKNKMMRSQTGVTYNSISFDLKGEMYVGLYVLTKTVHPKNSPTVVSDNDLETATNPYVAVIYRGKHTTMGRAIVNSCFPESFPFIDELLTKKEVSKLINLVLEKYGDKQGEDTTSKLAQIGFKFATIISPTIKLSDLEIPDEIYKLKDKMKGASIEQTSVLLDKMKKILVVYLKDTGLYDLAESGSTRGWDQPLQILAAKGIVADPKGNLLEPIKSSFSDGLTSTEFFRASAGARKGIIDRVLNTSSTGYLSRKLVYFLSTVEIDAFVKDCRTKRTLTLKVDDDLSKRLHGRFIEHGAHTEEFNPITFKSGSQINLRTPIYCKSPKICHVCYGKLIERHKTPYVGILAAQILGERGTQIIMRSFHLGTAKLVERSLLEEISSNEPAVSLSKLETLLKQVDNRLVTLKDCKITINLEDYDAGNNLSSQEDFIQVKSLLCQIEYSDVIFYLILDFQCNVFITKNQEESKEKIEITYSAGSTLLEVPTEVSEMKQQVQYIERLISGKEIYKDVEHLYRKLYKVYAPLSPMDSVHLEIVISQCLRDKSNSSIPARLGKVWNPELLNIRKTIFASGFFQGIAFENVNEAIKTGLISEQDVPPSIIEKLMTEPLVKAKR